MDAVWVALCAVSGGFILFGLYVSERMKERRERRAFECFLDDVKARAK